MRSVQTPEDRMMIPRIDIDQTDNETFDHRVGYESEPLFDDGGFSSVMHCLAQLFSE